MNEVLRDIHGLDPAPWWPPGPGWWLLLLVLLAALAGLQLYRHWRLLTGGIWRLDALRRLRGLRRRLTRLSAREAAGELSELLRRIAMAQYGREACAGLAGEDWLAWLADHDPNGFPWGEAGLPLISLPYAPRGGGDGLDLKPLVEAAEGWVRAGSRRRQPLVPAREAAGG
jgi:hypothetical protein